MKVVILLVKRSFSRWLFHKIEGLENLHIPGGAVKGVSISELGGSLKG